MKAACQMGDKAYLISRVLFLNGITRSGKFLLGKIVSCIKTVEYYQYVSILEHLPFLHRLGMINEEAAIALMRINVDEHAYNYLIGRNLNSRLSDASCIYNAPHFERYLMRSFSENIPALLETFKAERSLPCFVIHEMLPNLGIYFKAFPEIRVIDIHRHPIDLVHSWHRRGWGERYADDPLSFAPIIQGNQDGIPWYAESWKEAYQNSSPMDRVILSISFLTEEGEKTYQNLGLPDQQRMIRVVYESLVEETEKIVDRMAAFLDAPVLEALPAIMAREKVPKKISLEARKNKLREIEANASPKNCDLLHRMVRDYESTFQK